MKKNKRKVRKKNKKIAKAIDQKLFRVYIISINKQCGVSEVGYRAGLSRRRSRVRAPHIASDPLAQSVEQRTVNPCVAGSSPAGVVRRS